MSFDDFKEKKKQVLLAMIKKSRIEAGESE
jgi:hypothetical protein